MDNKQFSEREKDVIEHLLQGKSNKQIALELGISSRTVEFHLGNVYNKLGVSSRSEAILKLTEGQLRESTGANPGKSTVDHSVNSTENSRKPVLRRIPVKKLVYLLAGLTAVLLLAALVVYEPSPQKIAPNPEEPVAQTTPTIPTQVSTEISSDRPGTRRGDPCRDSPSYRKRIYCPYRVVLHRHISRYFSDTHHRR